MLERGKAQIKTDLLRILSQTQEGIVVQKCRTDTYLPHYLKTLVLPLFRSDKSVTLCVKSVVFFNMLPFSDSGLLENPSSVAKHESAATTDLQACKADIKNKQIKKKINDYLQPWESHLRTQNSHSKAYTRMWGNVLQNSLDVPMFPASLLNLIMNKLRPNLSNDLFLNSLSVLFQFFLCGLASTVFGLN